MGETTAASRTALALVLVLAATLDAKSGTAAEPTLGQRIYVYQPSNVRPPMLQKVLATALPGAEVMVFRHLRDFETTILETPPDFIISARSFVDRYEGWKPVLQGFAADRAEEPYVLVSVGKVVDPLDLPRLEIGVVDLLGKKDMPALVATLLGTAKSPKLIRVEQPEDLLPLLELNLAGAVLMPARGVPALREKSALDLRVTALKAAFVGLPAVGAAAGAPASSDMQSKLMGLPPTVKSMLGVDDSEATMRAWLVLMLVAMAPSLAAANATQASPTPDGGQLDTEGGTVLVLGPQIPATIEIVSGLLDELSGRYPIVQRQVNAETSVETLGQILRDVAPRVLVLLNNPTVRLYRFYQATQAPGTRFPPAVVLMAAFLEQAAEGLDNATGISYEIPAVTGFVNLRSLLGRPIRRIGVLYRHGFEGFVARQGELAAAEGFTLAGRTLDDGDRTKAVKRGLRRLLDYDRVDAIWVLNDSALLEPALLARAWLPVLRHGHVPVLVGVSSLVSAKLGIGTFAVLPDYRALGAQAARLIDDLAEANWVVGKRRALLPIAVEKVLDLGLARTLAPIREEKLHEVDRLIEADDGKGRR